MFVYGNSVTVRMKSKDWKFDKKLYSVSNPSIYPLKWNIIFFGESLGAVS